MPDHNDLTLLIDAAHASGDIARKFWKQSPEVWDKDNNAGPVTEADLAVDKMLLSELRGARSDYGWLSEETTDTDARLSHESVFIIDPIDGTRAFIEGSKAFAHSLAIARNGQVTAAVVYLPLLDRLYTASSDAPALLNGQPIAPSATLPSADITVLANKKNFASDRWHDAPPPFKRQFRSSLAYRMCLIAEGRFDAMLTLYPTWEWDVAAGALICEKAGAVVTDSYGAPTKFNRPAPQLDGIIAGNAQNHAAILAAL